MKRLLILAALILLAAAFKGGNLNAQEGIMAGNVLGLHVMEYELAQGVTDDELITFMKEKYMPGYEEHYTGSRMISLRGDRGELKGRFAAVILLETVEVRDKYAPEKDTASELGLAAKKNMKPIEDELAKLVKSWSTTYTDWVVIKSPFKSQGIPVAGNIMAIHTEKYELAQGVTDDEYINFYIDKWAPEWEKNFPGIKYILLKGIRGENEGSIGHLLLIESNEIRVKYWEDEGKETDVGIAAMEKMVPLNEQAQKMANPSLTYTDWLIE